MNINKKMFSFVGKFPAIYSAIKWVHFRKIAFVKWKKFALLVNMSAKPTETKTSKRILLATSIGAELVAWRLEALLGMRLKHDGHKIHQLYCDGQLTACQRCVINSPLSSKKIMTTQNTDRLCSSCFQMSTSLCEDAKIEHHFYSQFLKPADFDRIDEIIKNISLEDIPRFTFNDVPIGEHAVSGAIRYFAKSNFLNDKDADTILIEYFRSALLTESAVRNLLETYEFDVLVVNHGIYVPHGIVVEVAKSLGVRVVVWNVAYRKKRFIFSHDETYHHSLISEPTSVWEKENLSPTKDHLLTQYLNGRWAGKLDWIHFQSEDNITDNKLVLEKLGLASTGTKFILLTNVSWDAQLHYKQNVYENMHEWIDHTIKIFCELPNSKLVIRVHPAEVRGNVPSNEPTLDYINNKFPKLPDNIKLVGPNEPLSTYAIANVCDVALIYGTKMGVELTSVGLPVIVAGEAWIKNKGLTYDIKSKNEYEEVCKSVDEGHNPIQVNILKSRLYAYHFFFKRMIPIETFDETDGWPPFDFPEKLKTFSKGKDKGLDVIIDGIVDGLPFIYEEIS